VLAALAAQEAALQRKGAASKKEAPTMKKEAAPKRERKAGGEGGKPVRVKKEYDMPGQVLARWWGV
jgi:hypothetical protein